MCEQKILNVIRPYLAVATVGQKLSLQGFCPVSEVRKQLLQKLPACHTAVTEVTSMSYSLCSEVSDAVQSGRGVSTFQTVLILESSN